MSPQAFSYILDTAPLPAFSYPGEVAKVTLCDVAYTIRFQSAPTVAQTLENFEIFNNLPRELKTKIWGFAADARVITAIELPKRNPGKKDKSAAGISGEAEHAATSVEEIPDVSNAFRFIGAGIPSIFQVCKEVKELAGGIGYRAMFQVHGSSKMVYFNPYIDTLSLRTAYIRNNLYDQLTLSKVLVSRHELNFIRHLHMPHQTFNLQFDNAIKDISSMTSLKVLSLSGKFDTVPTLPAFTLKLDFEQDVEGGGAIAVADIPGNRLVGSEVVSLI